MTLIAVACKGDHAEFITDTASYMVNARQFRRTTKQLMLPHLDAAVLTSGTGVFGNMAKTVAAQEAEDSATFDDLVSSAPLWLDEIWRHIQEECEPKTDMVCTLILVGYSTTEDEFVAYRFSSFNEFTPCRLGALHVQPELWSRGPSDPSHLAEVGHYARQWAGTPEEAENFLTTWGALPPATAPDTLADWIYLAEQVRHERSLQGPTMRVYVAGSLLHTTLRCDSSSTLKVWDFDDTGEEFLKMVELSDHPQAQLAPCHCGSGERFIDCHMREDFDKPCACGSSKTLRECCMVQTDAEVGV